MAHKIFGLEENINLAGRLTTIREQSQRGKVKTFRKELPGDGARHWVEIQKDRNSTEEFDISEADFKTLQDKI